MLPEKDEFFPLKNFQQETQQTDLLMPHVVAEVLMHNQPELRETDLIYADLVARDMRYVGGHCVASIGGGS
tara:strand:- start:1976 stop:2188 length:213 start_codon:yes stop_codon:yes gene_type:complete